MSAMLAFEAVTAMRGGRVLFENLSFALRPGEAAVVRGPNGVGKSSLVRIAAGLLAPAAGGVTCRTARGLLIEAGGFDDELSLRGALQFWAMLDDAPDPGERVGRALEVVELERLADVPMRMLSTGQRRRAAIARVVASEAPVWLLDEPANGLDDAAVARLETMIAGHRAGGGAVLVATHQPLRVADAQSIVLGA